MTQNMQSLADMALKAAREAAIEASKSWESIAKAPDAATMKRAMQRLVCAQLLLPLNHGVDWQHNSDVTNEVAEAVRLAEEAAESARRQPDEVGAELKAQEQRVTDATKTRERAKHLRNVVDECAR